MNTPLIEKTGCIRYSNESALSFAVWVLIHDGLHVPPFNQHSSNGTKTLQKLGLTPQSWHDWVKLIAIRYDARLSLHGKNFDYQTEENKANSEIQFLQDAAISMGIDPSLWGDNWALNRKEELLLSSQNEFNDCSLAILDYPNINIERVRSANPIELYPDPAIQTQLLLLWEQYINIDKLQHINDCLTDKNNLWGSKIKIPSRDFYQIIFVDYPIEAELLIPPVVGLVTIPNKPVDTKILERRITNLINQNYHASLME